MYDFEITFRELLVSIAILFAMIASGFFIDGKINDALLEKYQKYDTAMQIDNDKSLFEYDMNTSIGNSFVYGELKALDTVTYDEIGGEYAYVKKVKERYTMHTRVVRSGKTTHVQTYWTWDYAGEESIHCKRISFVEVEFDYDKIGFRDDEYLDTIKESSHIRYKYYVTKTNYIGTLFANLENGTISNSSFHKDKTIQETIDGLESGHEHFWFWLGWIILTIVIILVFCKFQNDWLED